jgi:maleate isomerase
MNRHRPKRLGMLVPSSNTVLEPETAKLLPADGSVSVHVSRLRVVQIADDEASAAQFAYEPFLAAADLLADAQVDLILWNGTAAGWLGFDYDRRLIGAIEARTRIRATTAVSAINAALLRARVHRIGLVTPYVAGLERRIIVNYRALGIDVATAVRRDLTENTAYAEISPAEIGGMVREAARTQVDAVVILCTNLAGASIAPELEHELGVTVLDSVRVALAHSLALLASAPHGSA